MSRIRPGENIDAAAAAWFAKHEGGRWSAADQATLESWLDSATAHRIAYIRIAAAWERAERLTALGAGVPAGVIPPRDGWNIASTQSVAAADKGAGEIAGEVHGRPLVASNPSPIRGRSARDRLLNRRLVFIAASLLLGAATVWYVSASRGTAYSTPVGALASVPLSDGSTVTLNTNSLVHVAYRAKERRVTLDRGEAFFEVSKDRSRPFVVEIGGGQVTAVGTQFSVRKDGNETRVLVTEGRVRIDRTDFRSGSGSAEVDAGSEAQLEQNSVRVDQPDSSRVEQHLSWRTGYLTFHDTPLPDAIAEFNRYHNRKIVMDDPTLAALRIGGRFRTTDAEAFLWLLQSGFPISVAQRDDRISLTRR